MEMSIFGLQLIRIMTATEPNTIQYSTAHQSAMQCTGMARTHSFCVGDALILKPALERASARGMGGGERRGKESKERKTGGREGRET
jgi:hypothetical protein